MSVVVGHGDEILIPLKTCTAAPVIVPDYGYLAGQMPLIRQVFSLLL
jgi:hypothetical protein